MDLSSSVRPKCVALYYYILYSPIGEVILWTDGRWPGAASTETIVGNYGIAGRQGAAISVNVIMELEHVKAICRPMEIIGRDDAFMTTPDAKDVRFDAIVHVISEEGEPRGAGVYGFIGSVVQLTVYDHEMFVKGIGSIGAALWGIVEPVIGKDGAAEPVHVETP